MNFKTTKINNNPDPSPTEPRKKFKFKFEKKYGISLSIIGLILLITLLSIGIYKAIKSIDFTVFLTIAGDELLTDEHGHTNFLILGTGGENHEGSDLTDTILIASVDNESKLVTMLSIPRDLYVQDALVGSSKVNEVYHYATKYYDNKQQGLLHLKSKLEELIGTDIQYYLLVDFKGFKELVDTLGGLDLYVENDLYDPYYPKDGTFLYEPFKITQGQHHMDGETALKYARSRKTTSDFDRAKRQQDIIYAVKERALATDIILSTEKISEILNTLKDNIETNLTVKELLTLGTFAKDFSKDSINHKLIHDDPSRCGGLLYTPAREYYNGMFVLLPAGGTEFIHKYSELNFDYPEINIENPQIHVLNSTKDAGVAGETKQILKRFCFEIIRYGNGKDQLLEQTTYYYKQKYDEDGDPIESRPPSLDFLQTLIPGIESTTIPEEYLEYSLDADIIIDLGADYVDSENYIDDPFYYLTDVYSSIPTPKTSSTELNEETNATE